MSNIHIRNVHKSFDSATVLKGVNLNIPHGSVTALLGPSGCGKTTLLRLIAGFDPVDQGQIYFDDTVVASASKLVPPEKRGIGYVPQEGALFPHLTVEGNIRYGLPRKADWRGRVKEVLELTDLQGYGKRYPHELSGGQQQRVALARALAPDPRLVLLDEPFNALDLDLRRSICEDVIGVLRHTGTTAILVSHDPGEAFAVSDQLAVMLDGHIMQCDCPENIYWKPASTDVARLTGDAIFLAGTANGSTVNCALGEVNVHGHTTINNSNVTIMVRPEQVQWHNDNRGTPARVRHRSFRGDHTIIEIELGDICLNLRMSSISAPAKDACGSVDVTGACAAFSSAPNVD